MKTKDFIQNICARKNVFINVENCLRFMIDPAMDDDRELTAEEMAAIEDFTDRFCQGLSDLVRQAAPSANKILRQRIDFKDYTDSVHLASKFLWQRGIE